MLNATIALMILPAVFGVVIPAALFVWLKRRDADILPFFVGCAVAVLFVYVLEPVVHGVIFRSGMRIAIEDSIWSYALYGGIMAGIFEETGRLLAFRFALKNCLDNNQNALMYGVGHGGFIMFVLLTWSMALSAASTGGTIYGGIEDRLLGIIEQVVALILQIALSVLVWFAAKERGKEWLYFLAIVLHAAVLAIIEIVSQTTGGAVETELVFVIASAVVAYVSWRVWERETNLLLK